MKRVIILCLLLGTLYADEIARIESIVDDISKLRNDYIQVSEKLESCQYKLKDEQEKSAILAKELKLYSNYEETKKSYEKKILSLENKINILEKELKTKDIELKNQENKNKNTLKNQMVTKKCLDSQSIDNATLFPKLQMKKGFEDINEEIIEFDARAFRCNKKASLYDAIDGKVVDTWDKSTSFTSNIRTRNWIKITGYFVNKVWQKSPKELWIKADDASLRVRDE